MTPAEIRALANALRRPGPGTAWVAADALELLLPIVEELAGGVSGVRLIELHQRAREALK